MAPPPRFPLINIPRPFPSDYATNLVVSFGLDMRCIHNVFLRALNSLWENAPIVKPEDETAFAGYADAFCKIVEFHHHGEEAIVFPFLAAEVSMDENLAQHAAMSTGLDTFAEYVRKLIEGTEKYDGSKTRELIDGFGDVLTQHLHDEIPTLSPENLKKFDYGELSGMVQAHNKHNANIPGVFTVSPVIATHHNWLEVPEWPSNMSRPVKLILKYVTPLRHPSYWKFAPFTGTGTPRVPYSAQ